MPLKSIVFVSCVSLLLLAGCASFTTNKYGVSPENVEKLQSYADQGAKKISVQRLTSYKPGMKSANCRGASLKLANGMSFEDYISKALITELKLARLYSESAEKTLTGHFEMIRLVPVGIGRWIVKATFHTSTGRQLPVTSEYAFDIDFDGLKACQEAAQYFVPAINQFIQQVIAHPEFAAFLSD